MSSTFTLVTQQNDDTTQTRNTLSKDIVIQCIDRFSE